MKIVFTSCMDAMRVPAQPVWAHIRAQQPDVLMLLGDQIYMDWGLSFSSSPKWKRKAAKSGGLQAFAEDMHARYARQWAVAEFRDLLRWFVPARGADRLFVCWDDHDFAWNNSCGAGSDLKHSVPLAVRQVSRRLFNQFVAQMKTGYASDDYPAFDTGYALNAPVPDSGVEIIPAPVVDGVAMALLDERYYRLHRDEMQPGRPVAQFLGAGQMKRLTDLLQTRPPITVVAGGLPLMHKYAFGSDGWSGADNGEADYPDLKMFTDAAHSAVLYLGGDIHMNQWGGLMKRSDGSPGQVIQVASSGAAMGRRLVHRFPPAFGVVQIGTADGTADVSLCALNKQGVLDNAGPLRLRFGTAGWLDPENIPPRDGGPMHAVNTVEDLAIKDDLAVICFRARNADDAPPPLPDGSFPWEAMESLYDDELPAYGAAAYPQAVVVSAATERIRVASVGNTDFAALKAVCTGALERAAAHGRVVTLFVHGYNNGFAESVDEGYGLRDRFPGIEPIIFSWPSGFVRHGFLDGGYEFQQGMDNSEAAASGLYTALLAFKAAQEEFGQAHPGTEVKATLLVRSLGAMVLRHFLWKRHGLQGDGRFTRDAELAHLFAGFSAAVFSSPVLDLAWHGPTLDQLGMPVFVCINRNDKALRLTRLFSMTVLGSTLPMPGNPKTQAGANARYLDCTGFPGIADHHNFILDPWNADVTAAHAQVLAAAWRPEQLSQWADKGGQVWGKK